MARVAKRALVSGRVQGVGFRWSTVREAEGLGVHGWVRNLSDGRVEVHVEGEQADVGALTAWLHEGPAGARVDHVALSDVEPSSEVGFSVRR